MIYLFKTNVLRNSNTEIKGKLSLRSSYSNDFFNMPDKIFQEQEELEKKVLEAKEGVISINKGSEDDILV